MMTGTLRAKDAWGVPSTILLLSASVTSSAGADEIRFTEITELAGVEFALEVPDDAWFPNAHFFGGIGLADFDGNGATDIYFTGGGGDHDTLFLNDGTGHFTDASEAWGLEIIDLSCGVGAGDLDNDGWIDIVVASAGDVATQGGSVGNYRLYRNINGTRFENIAQMAGVNTVATGPVQHPTFATPGDFNADGHLDLLYGAWQVEAEGNRLFINNGNGTFTDVTRSMGFHDTLQPARSFSASVTDMDGDLHPDILWVADFNESRYFRNNGDGTFTNICPTNGTCDDTTAMGSAILDLNQDGRLDWLVSAIWYHQEKDDYNGNGLYMQIADHEYINMAAPFGLLDSGWSWSTIAADLDQDGLEEIVIGNGARYPDFIDEPEYIFSQKHLNGLFYNVTSGSGLDLACEATSAGSLDLEGDGDLDLVFICNKGLAHIYRNDTPDAGSWLQVELGGDPENRIPSNGFNSRVEARIGTNVQTRYMDGRPSYGASGPQSLHFGFGDATVIDELTVRWINGEVTVLESVAVNRRITIVPPGKVMTGDLDQNGTVDGSDLTTLLGQWGSCGDADQPCTGDLNEDGQITEQDLATLLDCWSTSP